MRRIKILLIRIKYEFACGMSIIYNRKTMEWCRRFHEYGKTLEKLEKEK